jgi:hypothetical protein
LVGWTSRRGERMPEGMRGDGLLVAAPGVFSGMMALFGNLGDCDTGICE